MDLKNFVVLLWLVAVQSVAHVSAAACSATTLCTPTLVSPQNNAVFASTAMSIQVKVDQPMHGLLVSRVEIFASTTSSGVGCRIGMAISSSSATTMYTYKWQRPPAGKLYLWAKAFAGTSSSSSSKVSVTVQGSPLSNILPIVDIVQGAGTYSTVTPVTFTTYACDLDGSIVSVVYSANGQQFGVDSTTPFSAVFHPTSAGTYAITAVAKDMKNGATSDTVSAIFLTNNSGSPSPGQKTVTFTSTITKSAITTKTATVTITSTQNAKTTTVTNFSTATKTVSVCPTTSPTDTTTSTPGSTTTTTTSTTSSSSSSSSSSPTSTPSTTDFGSGVVLTVINGNGPAQFTSWTGAPITANAPPVGQVFDRWSIVQAGTLQVSLSNKYSMQCTVKTNDNGKVTIQALYKVRTSMPFPVSYHPRLLITANDLPRLRSWAINTNPMYQSGLLPAANEAITYANSKWSWSFNGGTGKPSVSWSDNGATNYANDATEAYGMFFAFWSLIKNDITYARMARDMFLYILNAAVQNNGTDKAFGNPNFATTDRSRWWGESFGLMYDWLQYWPSLLSATDKLLVRKVFMYWANRNLVAYNSPATNTYNDPVLLEDARISINNYNSGHFRQLVFYALSFDAADDPATDPNYGEDAVGNTVRSFIYSATGAFLYQKYAVSEAPVTVATDYGVPPNSPNLGSMYGGVESEGSEYSASLAYVVMALLGMHTAGWNSATLSGPQMKLINSTYWESYVNGLLHAALPTPEIIPGLEYLGQLYKVQTFGDVEHPYIRTSNLDAATFVALYDLALGQNQARINKVRWMTTNLEQDGRTNALNRISNVWGDSNGLYTIIHFLLFDPASAMNLASLPDPRPSMNKVFYAPGAARLLARTNWNGGPTALFNYVCDWSALDHQHGDCGSFEFYRNGEWMTKEVSGVLDDLTFSVGASCQAHNTLCVRNSCRDPSIDIPVDRLNEGEEILVALGSQFCESAIPSGDPVTNESDGTGYVHLTSIFHNLYNMDFFWTPEQNLMDVLHVSRSIVWLQPDYIVVYDRATTSRKKFKQFNLQFVTNPTINGRLTTMTTAGGQHLYVTTLLPNSPTTTITASPRPQWNTVAEGEPSAYRFVVQDTALPADVRFFHVLQGADKTVAALPVTLITGSCTTGTLHGAVISSQHAVMFPSILGDTTNPIMSVSFILPAPVTKTTVTGLVPSTNYMLSVTNGIQISLSKSSGGSVLTDAAGVAQF